MKSSSKHKVLIIGAGLGGLLCGAILSKEGFEVLVLEKNIQIGGALQSYALDKKQFETAVHYIGSIDNGQTLHKIFNYLDIIDKLHLKRLDQYCYDEIVIGEDVYKFAQGYDLHKEQLVSKRPNEANQIKAYLNAIQKTGNSFPLYNLNMGVKDMSAEAVRGALGETMNMLVSDSYLQNILLGNNMLFAGTPQYSPFFLNALIQNSYIEGAFKFEKGSIQLAKALQEVIKQNGGEVKRSIGVQSMVEKDHALSHVITDKGETIEADYFISNIHPYHTYQLLSNPESMLKPVPKRRLLNAENTMSSFLVNISLKPKTITYQNYNSYKHVTSNVWKDLEDFNLTNINTIAAFYYQDHSAPAYSSGLALLVYMPFALFEAWSDSFRTTKQRNTRGETYEEFKQKCIHLIIEQYARNWLPELRNCISAVDACTPLSYRDYLNTPDGSLYGFKKSIETPNASVVGTKTKIHNLFLTGQNVNLHGILGVSITSLLTSSELVGLEHLITKINKQ